MKSTALKSISVLSVIFAMFTSPLQAGIMDYFPSFGDNSPEVLVVTGNYAKPRLLAEVLQLKKGYPILLVSAESDNDQIFYMPEYPDARLIPNDKLIDFLAVLSPRKIIVLGDQNYVPTRYVDTIRNRYPLVLIAGEDWMKNSKALADAIDYSKIVKVYREYLGQLLDDQIKRSNTDDTVDMEERILVP